jgi:hypothetical protein
MRTWACVNVEEEAKIITIILIPVARNAVCCVLNVGEETTLTSPQEVKSAFANVPFGHSAHARAENLNVFPVHCVQEEKSALDSYP